MGTIPCQTSHSHAEKEIDFFSQQEKKKERKPQTCYLCPLPVCKDELSPHKTPAITLEAHILGSDFLVIVVGRELRLTFVLI